MRFIHLHRTLPFLLVAALLTMPASAQLAAGNVEIVPLLRTTPSTDPQQEALVVRAVFPPGASTGRHAHPGDEYATVLEGQLELRTEHQPPRRILAGEAYHNPRGVIHETLNPGGVPARVISTFVVTRGQPLVQPAPAVTPP